MQPMSRAFPICFKATEMVLERILFCIQLLEPINLKILFGRYSAKNREQTSAVVSMESSFELVLNLL